VPGAEPVPFRFRRELGESEAMLARVRSQRDVFAKLLGPSVAGVVARFGASLAEVRPQRIFTAVAARASVDGVVKVEPFSPDQLDALVATTTNDRAVEALGGGPQVRAMVDRVMAPLRAELLQLGAREGRVDPKKLQHLPIAGQPVL
jgi:hypothetical protein